jgi:putative phosphoribosyl transferase
VIVAAPIASTDAVDALRGRVDACACIEVHDTMGSVGMWYDDFSQVEDAEVERVLAQSRIRVSPDAAVMP